MTSVICTDVERYEGRPFYTVMVYDIDTPVNFHSYDCFFYEQGLDLNDLLEKAKEIAYENNIFGKFIMDRIETTCLEMAKWKDKRYKIAYVVTRSEEHCDYVEKVFFDKEKAKEYCKPFNEDENSYYRDITEIEVSL